MKLIHLQSDFIGRPPRPMLRGKVYYIRQRIAGRDVWRSLHTRDKREAEFLALEIWRMRQTDQVKSIIPAPPRKLELIWENYRSSDRFADLADSTRDTKSRTWAAFAAWCKTHRIEYPEQLTADLAVSYLSAGGRKNKTFNNILNDLRQVFQFGGANCNVFETIDQLPIHRGKQEKRSESFRAFTDDEMDEIKAILFNAGQSFNVYGRINRFYRYHKYSEMYRQKEELKRQEDEDWEELASFAH